MSKWQIWSVDEYGQGSILATSDNIEQLIKTAKSNVHNENVENALTAEEKKRSWETFFVEYPCSKKNMLIYGGKDNRGRHVVYKISEKNIELVPASDIKVDPIIYLGILDGKDWFAEDEKRIQINSLKHPLLNTKTVYFLRLIK